MSHDFVHLHCSATTAAPSGGRAGMNGPHVPERDAPAGTAADLAAWLQAHARVTVITGAGVSTASGIPDYRDQHGEWKRTAPVTHQQFTRDAHTRRRYWARSLAGWSHFSQAQPNAAHRALAALQRRGWVRTVITQNVDALHQKAGATAVIDLHGRLDRVICLQCGAMEDRDAFQRRLLALNRGWADYTDRIAPDGDADIDGVDFDAFRIPACLRCGGMLKPDVVFYGALVPQAVRDAATEAAAMADGLLVVGSSLMVWSSYRLVRAAAQRGTAAVAVNVGRTRADDVLEFKCNGVAGDVLGAVADLLPRNR